MYAELFLAGTPKETEIANNDHHAAQVDPQKCMSTIATLYCICRKPNDENTYLECG